MNIRFTMILLFLINSAYAQSTIMIVGDSHSNGYQLSAGKSWASLLQQCINNMHASSNGQKTVMNTVWKKLYPLLEL